MLSWVMQVLHCLHCNIGKCCFISRLRTVLIDEWTPLLIRTIAFTSGQSSWILLPLLGSLLKSSDQIPEKLLFLVWICFGDVWSRILLIRLLFLQSALRGLIFFHTTSAKTLNLMYKKDLQNKSSIIIIYPQSSTITNFLYSACIILSLQLIVSNNRPPINLSSINL